MTAWKRRRVLVWGKTRPELSRKYREIVCTGSVLADTRELVRIYPVPLRYMDDEKVFKKYQWIEADLARNLSDPRPESYTIRADTITVLETIKPGKGSDWSARALWVMAQGNVHKSVEDLQDWQVQQHTSLGLIKPAEVLGIDAVAVGASETAAFMEKYDEATRQLDLPVDTATGRTIKPLLCPEYRFRIRFRCRDERCKKPHDFAVLDWEIDALYFNMRRQKHHPGHIAVEKVKGKLRDVTAPDKDLHFFLGNISSHPQVFTIVGLWYPKKNKQRSFDDAPEDEYED